MPPTTSPPRHRPPLRRSIAYGPSELIMMRAAFDVVWARIAPGVGDQNAFTAARTKLADAVFAVAKVDYKNSEDLARRVMEATSLAPNVSSRTSDPVRRGESGALVALVDGATARIPQPRIKGRAR